MGESPELPSATVSQLRHDHVWAFNGRAACFSWCRGLSGRLRRGSADVLRHCIIYRGPLCAHPVLAVQVRVQLFGLTHHWERASDLAQQQKATHVTNAIRGKYAITAIPTLSCGQTRTICQWGPSGISSARIGTCRYHCPCLPLQSGCPAVLDVPMPLGGLAEEDVWPEWRSRVQ